MHALFHFEVNILKILSMTDQRKGYVADLFSALVKPHQCIPVGTHQEGELTRLPFDIARKLIQFV